MKGRQILCIIYDTTLLCTICAHENGKCYAVNMYVKPKNNRNGNEHEHEL